MLIFELGAALEAAEGGLGTAEDDLLSGWTAAKEERHDYFASRSSKESLVMLDLKRRPPLRVLLHDL